jgi:hypothetical protein
MSNTSQGSGRWLTSDGDWYGPEPHPNLPPAGLDIHTKTAACKALAWASER